MGTNCAPLTAELFLYCYERDIMSNLQKSKRFDFIDKFDDLSRYLISCIQQNFSKYFTQRNFFLWSKYKSNCYWQQYSH